MLAPIMEVQANDTTEADMLSTIKITEGTTGPQFTVGKPGRSVTVEAGASGDGIWLTLEDGSLAFIGSAELARIVRDA
jgi:hypothetical protein